MGRAERPCAQSPAAYQEVRDENASEKRRKREFRGEGDRGPEGEGYNAAVEKAGDGDHVLPPIS